MAGRRNGPLCINGDFLTALRSFKENKPNDFNALMGQMCELANGRGRGGARRLGWMDAAVVRVSRKVR